MTLITKLLTNPLAHSRSTADTDDQSPALVRVHHKGRLSMAWNKVANDTVALQAAEAGRHPHDRATRTSSAALHPKRRIRVRWAASDVQIHGTGV